MMTLNAQRIAIAEWMGWEWHGDENWEKDTEAHYWKNEQSKQFYQTLPNYPEDLNAMHEVEKKLDVKLHQVYERNLKQLCRHLYDWDIIHVTANQKSNALCRTLWPERFE